MFEKKSPSLPKLMRREFAATVFVIENDQVLLIHHKKFQKWLPPGGHLESNETPVEAAIREAKEETGLDIAIVSEENLWIEPRWNARSLERPFMCQLENIPEINGQPPHQHIDMIYVGYPVGGSLRFNEKETKELKWFSLEEVTKLKVGEDIFEETFRAIVQLLEKSPVL